MTDRFRIDSITFLIPPPGSAEAYKDGCRCLEGRNKGGLGLQARGFELGWCYTSTCPVHGKQARLADLGYPVGEVWR
jgi:hypothetical protein